MSPSGRYLPLCLLLATVCPSISLAHSVNRAPDVHRRQAAASASTTLSPSASASASPASSLSGTAANTTTSNFIVVSGTTYTIPTTVPVTFHSVNPTAVPLQSITGFPTVTQGTVPLDATYTAGQVAPVSGAPPLPAPTLGNPSSWPALDKVPDTDSDEVKGWIQDVMDTGVVIPDFTPTQVGGCAANPALVGNSTLCWWTCGNCIRSTDITTCPNTMTWGLSFDDGPSPWTPDLLNYLDQQQLKSTFFIVGSRALSRPAILQAEYMGGHHLSVHTWSHHPLTTLTNEQIIAELGWTKKVIQEVTGVTPNTMRPPYGDIDDRVRAISLALGLRPIIWTTVMQGTAPLSFDTFDWHIADESVSSSGVIAQFDTILGIAPTLSTGFIVLSHDLYQQSVDLAIGYILPDALARVPRFTLQPIVNCLGLPLEDAYIETNDNTTNPPLVTLPPPRGSARRAFGASAISSLVATVVALAFAFNL